MIFLYDIENFIEDKITEILTEDYKQDIPRYNNTPSPPAKLKIKLYRDLLHFFEDFYNFSPDFEGEKENRFYEFCKWFTEKHELIERYNNKNKIDSRSEILEIE